MEHSTNRLPDSWHGAISIDDADPVRTKSIPATALVVGPLYRIVPDLDRWLQEAGFWIRRSDSVDAATATVDLCVVDGRFRWAEQLEASRSPRRLLCVGRAASSTLPANVDFAEPGELRAALRLLRSAIDADRRYARLRAASMAEGRFEGLVGRAEESHRLWARMLHCAERAGPVLIVGAPGTGKQLVGSTLHRVGPCSGGPLVRVECRSASGLGSLAVAVEEACGGTLLLVHADAALADEQGLAKIWATDDPAAPRVVATATTAPPGTSAGPFWSMFSHRLHLAPLASRPDDVDALAEHFLLERCRALGARKRWTSAALERLRRHDWPGNVRELEAVVRRAAAHSGSELGAASLPFPGEPLDAGCFEVRVGASIESVERRLILATLASCRGNKPEAARVLGISLKTLYNRLSLYRRCAPLDSEELG